MAETRLRVVGYVCRFCALLSADLGPARESRVRLELLNVPCAGKVDQKLLLAPFEQGADAVFIAGCPEHHCTSIKGSMRARKRLKSMADLLDEIGVGGRRLVMFNIAGTEGPRFAQIVNEMEALLDEIGPSPLNQKPDSTGSGDKPKETVQKDGEVCA